MVGGKGREKVKATFAVVQQSYEDPDAGDKPQPVLVPTHTRSRNIIRRGQIKFGEDLDYDAPIRTNMRMLDDDDEEGIFADEVEEEFDNDFIRQMLTGDGVEEEEVQELEDDEYPVHAERRPLEKAFDRMMNDFNDDEEIEEDDPRVRGPLTVEEYAPALEEFMREHVGASFTADEAPHHKGLINQLKAMALEHGTFDTTAEGKYVTTLDSDKAKRMNSYYLEDREELRQLTIERIAQGAIDTRDVLCVEEDEESRVAIMVPSRKKDRMDCETILSTLSNVYNHPTVLAAGTKKMRLNLAAAKQIKATRHVDPTAAAAASATKKVSPAGGPTKIGASVSKLTLPETRAKTEDELLFEDLPDEALPSLVDLSVRPEGESKDEKQMRRAIVKELQRERRAQKKTSREAYKDAGIAHANVNAKQKNDKAMVSLSVVRRS